ncbi:hypothetical protein ADL30_23190 [Streptomyces sp. NRRL S-1521]|nr:hypothetical protein ADL30_23190 [Streptomyces sp. NRRL S-1521]
MTGRSTGAGGVARAAERFRAGAFAAGVFAAEVFGAGAFGAEVFGAGASVVGACTAEAFGAGVLARAAPRSDAGAGGFGRVAPRSGTAGAGRVALVLRSATEVVGRTALVCGAWVIDLSSAGIRRSGRGLPPYGVDGHRPPVARRRREGRRPRENSAASAATRGRALTHQHTQRVRRALEAHPHASVGGVGEEQPFPCPVRVQVPRDLGLGRQQHPLLTF